MSNPKTPHRCQACGRTVPTSARFCPQCGAFVPSVIGLRQPTKEASEPEMSHRCVVCGAAVRMNARFCPQCGTDIERQKLNATTAFKPEPPAPAVNDKVATPVLDESEKPSDSVSGTAAKSGGNSLNQRESASEDYSDKEKDIEPRSPLGVSYTSRHDEGGRLPPSVEKLRHASAVMLDEAADDPSFRFLLVAALLFIVFVVLLLLNGLF